MASEVEIIEIYNEQDGRFFKNKKDYYKQYGAKTTLVIEMFKENENAGKSAKETEVELLRDNIVSSRMLHYYSQTYNDTKSKIGWV